MAMAKEQRCELETQAILQLGILCQCSCHGYGLYKSKLVMKVFAHSLGRISHNLIKVIN